MVSRLCSRHAGVFETSLRSCFVPSSQAGDYAKFLSHDLALLRIIETFSESAPQIVLMLTVYLQEGRLDLLRGTDPAQSPGASAPLS